MKILVVDDDQLTLQAISHVLKEEGYKVVLAEDVSKAINALENEKIDLIISDIMMPNVSGLAFLSMLKQFYLDKTPVILISSLDKGDIVADSLGLGAAYFLVKPLDMKELKECITNIVKQPSKIL